MLHGLIDRGTAAAQWDWRLTLVIAVLSVFATTQLITSVRSTLAVRQTGEVKTPAIAPYAVPFAGNLFAFAFDTKRYFDRLVNTYGTSIPIRIRILNQKVYYVSGAENVLSLFRGSRDLTTVPSSILILENAFGSPAEGRKVLSRDNTGIFTQPLEGSNPLEPHNRLFHLVHKTLHNNLSGAGLADLASRYMTYLEIELNKLDVGYDEWVDVPDFYALLQRAVFVASTTAVCGPHLFRLNPDFTADFWEFDAHAITSLFKNLPRWLIPKSFAIRDKLKASIAKWHKYALEKFDWSDEELAKEEWEEFYGSKLMRERQKGYRGVEGMDDEARAANDLGMIWGANANIVPMIGWAMLDILIRPDLLSKVRAEVASTMNPSQKGTAAIQMPKLLSNPLLQSIYCEELRLRNGVVIQRAPIGDNFKMGEWKFPKGRMIIASSWHEQRDRKVWNEGPVNGEFHSVEDFWAERFLVYPNDPNSGPRKPGSVAKSKPTKADVEEDSSQPKFTADSVTGSFIPYGGGAKICPGRFYAKQEALGALALFLTMFDIELKWDKKDLPQPNMAFFPFGVLPPLGKFPARMRRRRYD